MPLNCTESAGGAAGFAAHAAGDVERERERGDNGLGMRLKWLVSWQAGRFAQRGDARSLLSLAPKSVSCRLESRSRGLRLYI